MHFALIGRPTLIFKAVRLYTVLGDVRCVYGITLDGTATTCARLDDINLVADVALAA